jgi:hypothetical protein
MSKPKFVEINVSRGLTQYTFSTSITVSEMTKEIRACVRARVCAFRVLPHIRMETCA